MLCAVSHVATNNEAIVTMNTLFKTGYRVTHETVLTELVKQEDGLNESDIKSFLQHASINDQTKQDSLINVYRRFFIVPLGNGNHLIDVAYSVPYLVQTVVDVFRKIRTSSDGGRGSILEIQTSEAIAKLNSGSSISVIGQNKKLKVAKKDFLEVDIFLDIGGVYVLLDCKSILIDPEIEVGNHNALQRRTQELCTKFHERVRQVEKLVKQPVGDNFDFQGKIILSQLITAADEWIPAEIPALWWAKGVPKVSSIETFIDVVVPRISLIKKQDAVGILRL